MRPEPERPGQHGQARDDRGHLEPRPITLVPSIRDISPQATATEQRQPSLNGEFQIMALWRITLVRASGFPATSSWLPRRRYRKRISKIGLGTHQFGIPSWGYGERLRGQEAAPLSAARWNWGSPSSTPRRSTASRRTARPPRCGGGSGPVRCGQDPRFRARRADPRSCPRRTGANRPSSPPSFTREYQRLPVPEQRAVASANRLGIQHLDLYQVHQPVLPRSSIMHGIRALQQVGMVSEVGVATPP